MQNRPDLRGLARVRRATRDAHLRLESSLDLDAWDETRHRWWLGRLLGLREPIETQLDRWWAARSSSVSLPPWPPRRRTHLLWLDLRALGVSDDDVQALPRCSTASLPLQLPEVLGQLYVLDGSALGGAVIAQRAIANGVSPAACNSLLMRTLDARSWRETRSRIDALPPEQAARAAAAAADLFEVFEDWLTATPGKGHPGDVVSVQRPA